MDLRILDACSPEPLFSLEQDCLPDIMHIYLASIMHKGCERQSFTTRASTIVHHDLLRFTINPRRQQLRRFLLNFKVTFLKLDRLEEITFRRCHEANTIWSVLSRLDIPAERIFQVMQKVLPRNFQSIGPDSQSRLLI